MTKGKGIITSMSTIPQLKGNIWSSKRVWKVLFDPGTDDDIVFIKRSKKVSIAMHTQLYPQRWKTSNGYSETNTVGNVLLTLPWFSTPKRMPVRPNVQFIDEDEPHLMHDLIIDLS